MMKSVRHAVRESINVWFLATHKRKGEKFQDVPEVSKLSGLQNNGPTDGSKSSARET